MSNPFSNNGQNPYQYGAPPYTVTASVEIPSYTESQIRTYYQQYHCYPLQPYNVIPDFYVSQLAGPTNTPPFSHTEHAGQPHQPDRLAPREGKRSQTADQRSRSNSRTRTWTCDVPQCQSIAQFTRLADLQRHQATVHGGGLPQFPCTVEQCTRVGEKGFTRRDHWVEHMRNFHHIDIPKRKPGERSAFPMGMPDYQQ